MGNDYGSHNDYTNGYIFYDIGVLKGVVNRISKIWIPQLGTFLNFRSMVFL